MACDTHPPSYWSISNRVGGSRRGSRFSPTTANASPGAASVSQAVPRAADRDQSKFLHAPDGTRRHIVLIRGLRRESLHTADRSGRRRDPLFRYAIRCIAQESPAQPYVLQQRQESLEKAAQRARDEADESLASLSTSVSPSATVRRRSQATRKRSASPRATLGFPRRPAPQRRLGCAERWWREGR